MPIPHEKPGYRVSFVLIDELIFLQPRHHRPEPSADFFNRMTFALFSRAL